MLCQAFGAVGSLEAAYFRKTGTQKLLSEQMLMDCAWDPKDDNKVRQSYRIRNRHYASK